VSASRTDSSRGEPATTASGEGTRYNNIRSLPAVAGNPRFNPQREHDVRGRRRVDGKPERVSDREIANQSAVRIFTSRRSFSNTLSLCYFVNFYLKSPHLEIASAEFLLDILRAVPVASEPHTATVIKHGD
jgi:hypothetical protein